MAIALQAHFFNGAELSCMCVDIYIYIYIYGNNHSIQVHYPGTEFSIQVHYPGTVLTSTKITKWLAHPVVISMAQTNN